MKSSSSHRPGIAARAVLFGLASVALAASARAQVVYSENFDSGYNYTQTLSDQNGWTSNDTFTGATYSANGNTADIGQSDGVNFVGGGSLNNGDRLGILGGIYSPGTALPGRNDVALGHGFNLGTASTASVNLDFIVTQSVSPNANHDAFGFSLRNTAGGTLFSVDFTRLVNTSDPRYNTFDNIGYTAGSSTPVVVQGIQLGIRYHLTVTLNNRGTANQNFSVALQAEDNNTGARTGNVFAIANNVAYTGTVGNLAATWNLFSNATAAANGVASGSTSQGSNNTAYTAPGSNTLFFDNIVVAVPEPSTYALLGLGVFGLTVGLRARRAQRA